MKRYRICVHGGSVLFLMLSTPVRELTAPTESVRAKVLGGPDTPGEYLFKASSSVFTYGVNYSHNVYHRQVHGLLSRSSMPM